MSDATRSHFEKSLVFAHRGASTEAMENTRAAFDAALNYAIDGIETDVQLSQDGVTLLWHDEFLDKLGLAGKHIDDFDYAYLKTLHTSQAGSEGLMTLAHFLNDYARRCRLLVEVKNHDWEPVSRHEQKMQLVIDQVVAERAIDDHIMVSSFNLPSLVYIYRQNADISLVYNLEDDQTITDAQRVLDTCPFLYGLCLPIAVLDNDWIDLLRTHNKCIAVYTCNTDEEIDRALQLGVDILISDVPHKALERRTSRQNV